MSDVVALCKMCCACWDEKVDEKGLVREMVRDYSGGCGADINGRPPCVPMGRALCVSAKKNRRMPSEEGWDEELPEMPSLPPMDTKPYILEWLQDYHVVITDQSTSSLK
jgi:hypothetical protein